jgi:hypothetical protein
MTLHELVADKLDRADPATRDALLRIPLENIDRWIANGHTAPRRLEYWREGILDAHASPVGFQSLLELLELTLDADFLIEPSSVAIAESLQFAAGRDSAFMSQNGYYLDILRPAIADALPAG